MFQQKVVVTATPIGTYQEHSGNERLLHPEDSNSILIMLANFLNCTFFASFDDLFRKTYQLGETPASTDKITATAVPKCGFSQTHDLPYFAHFGAAHETPQGTFGFHQKAVGETDFATQASNVQPLLLSPIGSDSNACPIVRRRPDRRLTLPLL